MGLFHHLCIVHGLSYAIDGSHMPTPHANLWAHGNLMETLCHTVIQYILLAMLYFQDGLWWALWACLLPSIYTCEEKKKKKPRRVLRKLFKRQQATSIEATDTYYNWKLLQSNYNILRTRNLNDHLICVVNVSIQHCRRFSKQET